ncbi:tRNA pseudouridine(13) synthase TruD [Anaeromyxobacter diazotrophicus]|uniref:tRNA pseudouridine(13) synthase TruD n=1 Tax=Anaeromyxobacter diazotrophicus TaxID=2590199 RepID=A0A7I9VNJ4_9BACT|nr:tRNA pseudouridine(13) synthase TruD [Anaeromyxobacter diazotrophicus]GEJ57983.1 tRNA pseudouridine(13) synthase TruD [Anaeromyxobacter diazotrophicus]
MKLKQRPEDFSVTESWRFDQDPRGAWFVYLMDKQKLSTFEAVERICARAGVQPAEVSYCGLKDKQGRTTQLVAVRRKPVDLQDPDLRLKPLGRTGAPLSAVNTTSNRFAVTVRDLSEEDVARLPAAVAEVQRIGVVDYFDSQRFGSLKHGQGFLVKDLMRGDAEAALRNHLARPSELDRTADARVKTFWKEHWGEWQLKNPYPGAERYAPVLRWLRLHPQDFLGAFLRTEPRWRGLQVFAYQSWLWNEGVKQYLRDVVGVSRLVSIRYQAGTLLFPRALEPAQARLLHRRTFPLLAPDSRFDDPAVEKAALSVLGREDMTLASLAVPGAPQIHFDHEERPLLVVPGKLVVSEPSRDELNKGRLRVNVAFTLPPGAYATLVVKRLFWWTLTPGPEAKKPAKPPRPTAEELHAKRRETGFLAKKRARKAARAKPAR